MFSGLIEKVGTVENITLNSDGAKLSYFCIFEDNTVKIGDSIAVNGVCLTVTAIKNDVYTVDIMEETLNCTNLKYLKRGDKINLERAVSVNSRLNGHIVSGHVDTMAKVKNIIPDGFSKKIEFTCNSDLIILKGSICINGVSLTVSNVSKHGFETSLIPTTLNCSNLENLKINDIVNIEYDMPLRRSKEAKVRDMGVATALHTQARVGRC